MEVKQTEELQKTRSFRDSIGEAKKGEENEKDGPV